jgi:rhodanese-related sulfurtransferase
MSPEELARRVEIGELVTVIDVRRESAYFNSGRKIPGSTRIAVDDLLARLGEIPRDRPVVLSCA